MARASPTWLPSIDQTPELIGLVLLFIPYAIILLPLLQHKIVKTLQTLYLHHTPRDDWNLAVDQHPPRRLLGYIFCIVFTFTAISLLLVYNSHNHYWIDFAQYFIYLSIPLIVSILRPPSHRPCDVFDLLIILLVLIPLEISQIVDTFLPDIRFSIYSPWGASPNISVLQLSAFNILLFIFFIFRPLDRIGLGWNTKYTNCARFKWILFRLIAITLIFLVFAVPFCTLPSINYLHPPQPLTDVWRDGIARFFCLFFLQILPSEFLYRGIIQNLLHSALEFRHEARSYLRGNPESVVSMLDKRSRSDIEMLTSSGKRRPRQEPLVSVDIGSKYSASDAGCRSNSSDTHTKYSMDVARDTMGCERGMCFFLRFEHVRDWFVVISASVLYAFTVMDYKHFATTKDLIYGVILMFWFGVCCGWLFRLTHSCLVSAVLHSLILFNFKYIFNPNTQFCNGACT